MLNYVGIKEKGGCIIVVKKKSVSSKTHTQKQLDDYANQNNPNNKAYHAKRSNQKAVKQKSRYVDAVYPLEWMYYSNPYDFD